MSDFLLYPARWRFYIITYAVSLHSEDFLKCTGWTSFYKMRGRLHYLWSFSPRERSRRHSVSYELQIHKWKIFVVLRNNVSRLLLELLLPFSELKQLFNCVLGNLSSQVPFRYGLNFFLMCFTPYSKFKHLTTIKTFKIRHNLYFQWCSNLLSY